MIFEKVAQIKRKRAAWLTCCHGESHFRKADFEDFYTILTDTCLFIVKIMRCDTCNNLVGITTKLNSIEPSLVDLKTRHVS